MTARPSSHTPPSRAAIFAGKGALYLVAAVFVGFCLLPIYVMITTALKNQHDVFAAPPVFLFEPTLVSIKSALFGGNSVVPYLVNSAIISGTSTVFATLLGAMAAYGLARFTFRGREDLGFWILSTRMAPPVAFVVPIFILARNAGLIDTRTVLIIVYTSMNLSFVTWVLLGFFRDIPAELEEAALIERLQPVADLSACRIALGAAGSCFHGHPLCDLRLERVPVRADLDQPGRRDNPGLPRGVLGQHEHRLGRVHGDRVLRRGTDHAVHNRPSAPSRPRAHLRSGQVRRCRVSYSTRFPSSTQTERRR